MAGYRDPPLHKLQLVQKMESKIVQSVDFKLLAPSVLWPLSATPHWQLASTLSPNHLFNPKLKAVRIQTRLSSITIHLTFLFSIIDTHCLAFSKNPDLMVSVSCDTECPMSRMITIASWKKIYNITCIEKKIYIPDILHLIVISGCCCLAHH